MGSRNSAKGQTIAWRDADAAQDMPQVRAIFTEYAQSLDVDLRFQSFDDELTNLPGHYAAPRGARQLRQSCHA